MSQEVKEALQKAQTRILDKARSLSSLIASKEDIEEVNALANEVKGLLDAFDLINVMLKEGRGKCGE